MSIQPNALGGARPELWHKNMNIDGEVDLEESVEVWTRGQCGGEVINGVQKSPSVHTALEPEGQQLLLQWRNDADRYYGSCWRSNLT